jgi:hypothetical protein
MMTWLRRTIAAIVLISFSCAAFADSPSESGVVIREDVPTWFVWWYDEENNTTAYFGVDPLLACFDNPDGWQPVPVMRVFMGTDDEVVLRFKRLVNSTDMLTSVWPGLAPSGGPGNVCLQILFGGVTPIANGWSHFRFNDNDTNPSLNPDRHNMNSAGFNANGVLINYDTGEPMRFMMYAHLIWDGIDFASTRTISKTKLQ